MTTDSLRVAVRIAPWLGAVLLVVFGCSGLTAVREGDTVNVAEYPPEIQQAYEVFAFRCSKCHTLARPLNAHITDPEHWRRYVTRMRRNPSSGINKHNAEVILRFLLYYTEREKGADQDLDQDLEHDLESDPYEQAAPSVPPAAAPTTPPPAQPAAPAPEMLGTPPAGNPETTPQAPPAQPSSVPAAPPPPPAVAPPPAGAADAPLTEETRP